MVAGGSAATAGSFVEDCYLAYFLAGVRLAGVVDFFGVGFFSGFSFFATGVLGFLGPFVAFAGGSGTGSG